MRKLTILLLISIFISGCASQPPARVAAIKPTIKRTAPSKLAPKAEFNTIFAAKRANTTAANDEKSVSNIKKNKSRLTNNNVTWGWPVKGKILTNFGATHTTFKGIDIGNAEGTPILAAGDGEVVYSGDSLRGYGNLIIIKHNKNFLTAYAHNRKNMVKEGDSVSLGQRIAEMGRTGTDKVKLHFEVRYQGKPVDPQGVLPPR